MPNKSLERTGGAGRLSIEGVCWPWFAAAGADSPAAQLKTFGGLSKLTNGKLVMNQKQTIEAYYRAFRERDRETLRSILTPDFHHMSSFGEWNDRDAMLEAIWPEVGHSWAEGLQIFGEAPNYMVRYKIATQARSERPPMSMAEFIRFEGSRISEIEVYTGRELAAVD